ncbi:hypothetical protein [Psychroserpens luteus]|uniref:Uncharacterized protein n=1 Tax=Psychroserpens luteus TaxID=1434066 RepID=A0ABW5ZVS5_9FLAO|nr:hypothetical protein [Psychroserpens luteus]
MDASIVYKVAQALPKEERVKLYRMLKSDLIPKPLKKKDKIQSPEFTDEDALEYLFEKLNIEKN